MHARVVIWMLVLLSSVTWGAPAHEEEKLLEEALTLIHRILNDPMMPVRVHGARCVRLGSSDGRMEFGLVPAGDKVSRPGDFLSIRILDDGHYDFMLLLADDTIEHRQDPDWEQMAPRWDAFVSRYWPGLRRASLLEKERKRWVSGSGTFVMQWALKQNEAEVFRVMLGICLADGKLRAVSTSDERPLLAGKPVPPPPTREIVFEAVHKALTEAPQPVLCKNLRPVEMRRWVRTPQGGGNVGLYYGMDLRADAPDGRTIVVVAEYYEAEGRAEILAVYDEADLSAVAPSDRVAQDTAPQWSAGGRHLYFTTTREVDAFPFWQGGAMSAAFCAVADGQGSRPTCLRPIKPLGTDGAAYEQCVPSPSGRYVAGTLLTGRLFLLKLEEGTLYLPERDRKWREKALRLVDHENNLPQGLAFIVRGVVWLPDESGLLGSFAIGIDPNLYLALWQPETAPREVELIPLVMDRGDDVLPCLDAAGKRLAWARKAAHADSWELIIGAFDAGKREVTDRVSVSLPAEPTSISWAAGRGEWLVVAGGRLLWVKETPDGLILTPAGNLRWEKMALRPTGAAVSPRDGTVAVAAELAEPWVDPDKEVRVLSCLFRWDGKSEQVRPLIDPSLTGLPRYKFPRTGQPWARIHGNLEQYGLRDQVDAAWVEDKERERENPDSAAME